MFAKAWILAGTLALAALACSSPQQAPSPSGGGAVAPAQETPKPGGRLTLDIAFEPNNWDTTKANRRQIYYTAHTMGRLLRFKSGEGIGYEDTVLEPEMAEKWAIAPDGKSFTFNLRKGVKFQNLPPVNGREFTSADVKFTLEYVSRTGEVARNKDKLGLSNESWLVAGLSGVTTPDPYTAVVQFGDPFVPFINYVSICFMSILPREIYDADGDFTKKRIGTGPFYLDTTASQSGSRLVYKKHPGYWEAGKPYLDEVYQLIIPDEVTQRAAFAAKQLDIITERISSQVLAEIEKSNPQAVKFPITSPGPGYIWLNSQPGKPMADVRIRRAFSLAMDRDELIKTFSGGKGLWAFMGALPGAFTQDEIKKVVRYDVTEAKKLLADAGYPNGLNLELLNPGKAYGDWYNDAMELIQAQEKKAGINVTIRNIESAEVAARGKSGDYQIAAGGTLGLFADIDSNVFGAFHPSSGNNSGHVDDPKLTAMIEAQRKEADPKKRQEALRAIGLHINENVWGQVPMFRMPTAYFWHPYVKGYYPNFANAGTAYTPDMTTTWISK